MAKTTPCKRLRGTAPVARLESIVFLVVIGLTLAEGLNQEPSEDTVLPAEFRWAQRKDRILLTIELQVRSTELDVYRHVLWAEQTTAALQYNLSTSYLTC